MKLSELTRNRGIRSTQNDRIALSTVPTIGGATTAAAAVRRANRPVLLVVCLPLLLALAGATGGRVCETVAARQRADDQQRVGRFTRAEAARWACYLVARVSGVQAGTVEAVAVEVYTKRATPGVISGSGEWDVLCRTPGRDDYIVRLAADSGEPLLVRTAADVGEKDAASVVTVAAPAPDGAREGGDGNEGNGDLRRRGDTVLSHREASLLARRYLRLVGLPLPADARLVRDLGCDFNYDCDGPKGTHGTRRTLRVRVNPRDGSLEHLHNVVYRK